jgi:ATP-binding cassette subfamily B protein
LPDSDFRRLLGYVAPYWRRLVLVLVLSLVGTALSLLLPYLTRLLIDRALLGRDTGALVRIVLAFAALTVASFALNVVSGLRYTRVSADILFDMRLALFRHLQRLSPRASTATSARSSASPRKSRCRGSVAWCFSPALSRFSSRSIHCCSP